MKLEEQSHHEKQQEALDDNARKFVIEPMSNLLLEENGAVGFLLSVDWLEIDKNEERKIVYKKFDNGDTQTLQISKTTRNGKRVSQKVKISKQEYDELLNSSVRHLEKRRYEFEHIQDGKVFDIKYDNFIGSDLHILEVDATTEEDRYTFNTDNFPSALSEVTGQLQYYGYRVTDTL